MSQETQDGAVAGDGAQIRRRRLKFRLFRRFSRSDDGSTAVEFALISVPFLALIFAIVETALVLWASQVLETAVANASRRIFTGEFQAANGSQAANLQRDELKKQICAGVPGLFNCGALLELDVRVMKSFVDVKDMPPLVVNRAINTGQFTFQPSARQDIVVIRAVVPYQIYVALLPGGLPDLDGNKRLIAAVSAFRNEPF